MNYMDVHSFTETRLARLDHMIPAQLRVYEDLFLLELTAYHFHSARFGRTNAKALKHHS